MIFWATNLLEQGLQREQHVMHCSYLHFSQHQSPLISFVRPEIPKSNFNIIKETWQKKMSFNKSRTSNNDLLVFGSSIVGKYWRALIVLTCINQVLTSINMNLLIHWPITNPQQSITHKGLFLKNGNWLKLITGSIILYHASKISTNKRIPILG